MKALLTGFEPFGGLARNPSQEIIASIAARDLGDSIRIFAETLKTEYDSSAKRLVDLMETFQPDVVLCLGVAVGSDEVRLERVALNVNDCLDADNAGDLRRGKRIAVDGPDAYFSGLPLHELQVALSVNHPHVIVSNHAGAYVCNHVFYTASHHANKVLSRPACGFIHVPLHDVGIGGSSGFTTSERTADIVIEAIVFLTGWMKAR